MITRRDKDIFDLLNRYRYLRRTFIHHLLGHPVDAGRLRHRIGKLYHEGHLTRPEQQKQSANFRYSPKVYELKNPERPWTGSPREFWHQLMISDIVASFQIIAMHKGLEFKDRWQIIGDTPLKLSLADGWLKPDELFSINGAHFFLEADRGTEQNTTSISQGSSWGKKISHYSEMFDHGLYKQLGLPNVHVLCVFSAPPKAENVRLQMSKGNKSARTLFKASSVLGSHEKTPTPLLGLLDDPWKRPGFPDLALGKEVVK